jgi:hypothetical protein
LQARENPSLENNPGFCLASAGAASGKLPRSGAGAECLSPEAVDKSVHELSSSALTPFWQRLFLALPKNKASRLSL